MDYFRKSPTLIAVAVNAAIIAMVLIVPALGEAQEAPLSAAALLKARSTVQQQLQHGYSTLKEPLSQLTITDETITVNAVPDERHFRAKEFPPGKFELNLVDFMELGTVPVEYNGHIKMKEFPPAGHEQDLVNLLDAARVTVKQEAGAYRLFIKGKDPRKCGAFGWTEACGNFLGLLTWGSGEEAQAFADSINLLGKFAVLASLTHDGFPVSAKLDVVTGVPDTREAREQATAWQGQLIPTPITIWKARRLVSKALEHGGYRWMVTLPANVQITDTAVEFVAHMDEYHQAVFPSGKVVIDLTKIGALTTYSQKNPFNNYVTDSSDMCARGPCYCTLAAPNQPKPPILDIMCWNNAYDAHAFVGGMNRLRAFARGEADKEADWRDFQQKAAAWRALPAKPPLAEEVRQHRVLAENAFKEKQFDVAVEHYEEGLDLDPLWPQGHFNAALMYAELKHYADAIQHMRCYVELSPQAPDVQDARDQIVIWQDKLRQQAAAPVAK